MQNPVFREIIAKSRAEFVQSNKFKIYARLFAEIILQVANSDVFQNFLERAVVNIFYNEKLSTKIEAFELRLQLLIFSKKYVKSSILENNWNEFMLIESIIDPYGLVEKINRLTKSQDAQS